MPPRFAAISEGREAPKQGPSVEIVAGKTKTEESAEGFETKIELFEQALDVVGGVGQAKLGVRQMRGEQMLDTLEHPQHLPGEQGSRSRLPTFQDRSVRGSLVERVRLDHVFDEPDERFEFDAFFMAFGIGGQEPPKILEEMARAALDDDPLAEDEFRGMGNLRVAVANQRNQAIIDGLEFLKIHDEFDARFRLGQVIVRQVAGTMVDAAEPARFVHPAELVFGEVRPVESGGEFVVYPHDLAIEDQDAGPPGKKSFGDRRAVSERRHDVPNDRHDRVFRFAVSSRQNAQRRAFQTLAHDPDAALRIGPDTRQETDRPGVPADAARDPGDRSFNRSEKPFSVPFGVERPAFRATNHSFFWPYFTTQKSYYRMYTTLNIEFSAGLREKERFPATSSWDALRPAPLDKGVLLCYAPLFFE